MTPATLRARIAASDGSDQGEILEAAFRLLLPAPKPGGDEYHEWGHVYGRFRAMITCGAQESAALMIAEAVLPGCRVVSWPDYVEIYPDDGTPLPSTDQDPIATGDGKTRALAIIDAVCAAK